MTVSKVYDGELLKAKKYTVNNFLEGYYITDVVLDGEIVFAGEITSTADCSFSKVYNSNDNDVTENFIINTGSGILRVEPRPITISLFEKTKQYDATALTPPTNSEYWISNGNTINGDYISGVYDIEFFKGETRVESVVDSGEYTVRGNVKIYNDVYGDISYCYKVDCSGTMTIEKRLIKFTVDEIKTSYSFADLRRVYNTILDGHIIESSTGGSVAEILANITVYDQDGVDVTKNYSFNCI